MTLRLLVTAATAMGFVGITACAIAPLPEGGVGDPESAPLPPPGYGTLAQVEVSMSMRSDDLEIMVTPLEDAVTLVTAPDTHQRLSRTAAAHRPQAPAGTLLFLVSFYSENPDTRFVPEEVQIISRGLRFRPAAILPVTPTWGQRRIGQRETEMAVYAFPPEVDLDAELALAYGLDQSASWTAVLTRIRAERARARARAGIGLQL